MKEVTALNIGADNNPFGGDINDDELKIWLSQFDKNELPFIWPLLKNFRYYNNGKVCALVKSLYQRLRDEVRIIVDRTCFVPVGYVAKSGDIVAYLFRRINGLPETSFYRVSDLNLNLLKERPLVVFLDDFIGSGGDAIRLREEVVKGLKGKAPETSFIFGSLVGYEEGIERIKFGGLMDVYVAEKLSSQFQPFVSDSHIYPDIETRRAAESIIRKYTDVIKPKSPHGFGNIQGLVSFFYGTPNSTLPLFWSKTDTWNPLLPYGESLRDPSRLITLPGTSETSTKRKDSDYRGYPGSVFFHLEKSPRSIDSDYSREATHSLVEMFETLQPLEVAVHAFRNVGIEERTIQAIAHAMRFLKAMKHEGRPVRSALFFPSQSKIKEIEQNLYLRMDGDHSLDSLEHIETICRLADGLDGAIVVSADGRIKGAGLYPNGGSPPGCFAPIRYQSAAAASYEGVGLVFLFLGNDKIVLFDRGYRVMSHIYSQWHIQGMLDASFLAAEHGLVNSLLERVMMIAIELVNQGQGALFTLGDAEGVRKHINKKGTKNDWNWQNLFIGNCDLRPIIYAAREDGATMLDERGLLIENMIMLAPPTDAAADEEIGKGSRHNTASKISAVTGALSVAVSQEGTITLYSKGRRVFRVMG